MVDFQSGNYNDPRWVVLLSDGRTVYKEHSHSWIELKEFLKDSDLTIEAMYLQFRSHQEVVAVGAEGYYFSDGVAGDLFENNFSSMFVAGFYQNGEIHVIEWKVPELTAMITGSRDPIANERKLIINAKKALSVEIHSG